MSQNILFPYYSGYTVTCTLYPIADGASVATVTCSAGTTPDLYIASFTGVTVGQYWAVFNNTTASVWAGTLGVNITASSGNFRDASGADFPANLNTLGIQSNGHLTQVDTVTNAVNTNANATETAIKAKTDLIATNSADSPNAITAQGNASTAATASTAAASGIALIPTNPLLTNDSRLNHLDANISSRMATYTQPVGFLAATFPTSGTVAKAGDQMDLVNAPNATAIAAIQSGVATELFVDGSTNKLKVNPDNSVNAGVSGSIAINVPLPVAQASPLIGQISVFQGNSLSDAVTMGNIIGYAQIWFTVKAGDYATVPDSAALIQITSTGGLIILNGAAAPDSTQGSLVVNSTTTGSVSVLLSASVTAQIQAGDYTWGIKWKSGSGTQLTTQTGTFSVVSDVTMST